MSNWFTRLFTVSKHTDPAVAAIEKPALDAAHAAVSSTVTAATEAVNPIIDEAVAAADQLADTYLAKMGVAGQLLSPAAHAGVQIGAAAIVAAIQAKLGLKPGDTVPAAAT